MALKTVPMMELRSLLDAVSTHGIQHLVEVEADLLQTTYLLTEAIDKLGVSFMAVHSAVTEQQKLLDGWIEQHETENKDTSVLEGFKHKIAEEVNAAVTGLQFQDLTSQLIARTLKRVNGLKGLLEELASHSDEIVSGNGQEYKEIARLLEEMNKNLNSRSNALSGGLRRSVNQENMTSGEIELF